MSQFEFFLLDEISFILKEKKKKKRAILKNKQILKTDFCKKQKNNLFWSIKVCYEKVLFLVKKVFRKKKFFYCC